MAEKPDQEEYKLASKFGQMKLDGDFVEESVQLLTWNTNYGSGQVLFFKLRDTIIPIVQDQFKHCISFLQEIQLAPDSVTQRWGFCQMVMPAIGTGIREAGVSTPPGSEKQQLKLEPGEKLNDESKWKPLGVEDKFTKRMCGQKVIVTRNIGQSKYTGNITVLSYHAVDKEKDTKKMEIMIDYFKNMCQLADTLMQTIIIGGDFNYPVLDWKDRVEKEFPHRVSVAQYVGTPRRWVCDKVIDTFVIVQPSNPEHQSATSTFEETMAIYPFPMAGCVGGSKKSTLKDYPSQKNRWFKYLHFGTKDHENLKEILKEKVEKDIQNQIENEQDEDKKKELKENKKALIANLEQKRLSEPFTRQPPAPIGPPVLLWPNSSLHDVLDHDPVLTKITVFLKRKSSTQDNTSATPEKRQIRNTK